MLECVYIKCKWEKSVSKDTIAIYFYIDASGKPPHVGEVFQNIIFPIPSL